GRTTSGSGTGIGWSGRDGVGMMLPLLLNHAGGSLRGERKSPEVRRSPRQAFDRHAPLPKTLTIQKLAVAPFVPPSAITNSSCAPQLLIRVIFAKALWRSHLTSWSGQPALVRPLPLEDALLADDLRHNPRKAWFLRSREAADRTGELFDMGDCVLLDGKTGYLQIRMAEGRHRRSRVVLAGFPLQSKLRDSPLFELQLKQLQPAQNEEAENAARDPEGNLSAAEAQADHRYEPERRGGGETLNIVAALQDGAAANEAHAGQDAEGQAHQVENNKR